VRQVAEQIELAGVLPGVDVSLQEYARLLGYPRGWVFEGRAKELAECARAWYAAHGRPWFYARQAEQFDIAGDAIRIEGVPFSCARLKHTLQKAEAHSVILVGVGAGAELEEEAQRRWRDEKPDEYFFLEVFGSAVVEQLTAETGARLCDWAEQRGMVVLPHYSPGYPEWDVAEQVRLLELIQQTQREIFPSHVEIFETGMLRPKKTLLAVFGLTQHKQHLRSVAGLIPCENCSWGPCQYRRAPYRRAPRVAGEPLPVSSPVLDRDAQYSVNRRALERWARQRLSISERADGSLDAVFRYDGTTCTNMGRPLAFDYHVRLGPRAEGYPIREQRCVPAAGDTGHTAMCEYLREPERLMDAIETEKPLNGERLDAVLSWQRVPNATGCYCEAPGRMHKWGLVLETIHYALAQKEIAPETEP
jgi:hypothetical protein